MQKATIYFNYKGHLRTFVINYPAAMVATQEGLWLDVDGKPDTGDPKKPAARYVPANQILLVEKIEPNEK